MVEPRIDDRRRFSDLWKELVWARLLGPIVAGTLAGVALSVVMEIQRTGPWILFPIIFFSVSMPSVAAKRGRAVGPAVSGAALVALAPPLLLASGMQEAEWGPVLGAVGGASIGVAEGLFERSIATITCGTMGGALSGWAAGWVGWFLAEGPLKIGPGASPLENSGCFVGLYLTGHLGIGLSLALGRWIRDWPKRRREGEAGSAGAG